MMEQRDTATGLLPPVGRYEMTAEPFHCDHTFHLFMGHMGNAMLNAADYHSNDRGYGVTHLQTIHRTWVLSRLAIEMEAMPRAYDRFAVETWVESAMRSFTSRNYAVTGPDGRVYGYGRSIWAMIDTDTRQPADILQVNNGLIMRYIDAEKPCPIAKPTRVKIGSNAELVRTVDTYYNDVDINGHINSMKYVEHVLDLFDLDWWSGHHLRRLDVAYVAEAHQGDRLLLRREQTAEGQYAVSIAKSPLGGGDEVEVCRCSLIFVKRLI